MRIASILATSTLLSVASAVIHAAPPNNGYVGQSSNFSVDAKTEIPSTTLKPGQYSIRVLDQLSDRMIVRVDSSSSKDYVIFLGVPRSSLSDANSAGPVAWKTAPEGNSALRGFRFSSGSVVEFVYPKTEAIALAKANAIKVVAVDPESEGKPKLKNMSKDDLQVVSLWTLSLTTASPNDKTPAILAQKFQNDDPPAAVVVAKVSPAPSRRETQVAKLEQPSTISSTAASPKHSQVLARLPHTASYLPLFWMVGILSLFSGMTIRILRYRIEA
jgi:hypothetical protein